MSSALKMAMALQVLVILLVVVVVDEQHHVSAQAQVPIIPGGGTGGAGSGAGAGSGSGSGAGSGGSSNGGGSACNFRYMMSKYNGCQTYVLTGSVGSNITEQCCKPMAKFAHECGACTPMLRPFANSLLGVCNLPSC